MRHPEKGGSIPPPVIMIMKDCNKKSKQECIDEMITDNTKGHKCPFFNMCFGWDYMGILDDIL